MVHILLSRPILFCIRCARIDSLKKFKSTWCPSNCYTYKDFDRCLVGLPKQGTFNYLNQIGWMLDIRVYGIGLLDEAIKLDLGLGHGVGCLDMWCRPTNRSHIGCDWQWLSTSFAKFLAVMPKLTRGLDKPRSCPLCVVKGNMIIKHIVGVSFVKVV